MFRILALFCVGLLTLFLMPSAAFAMHGDFLMHAHSYGHPPGLEGSVKIQALSDGIGYVFRQFDIILVFVAIAYAWLYVDSYYIGISIALTVLGVYIAITYIDLKYVPDPNYLRAGLFFFAGIIVLSKKEINEKFMPVVALPTGIFSALLILTNIPNARIDQDFINGAFVGILFIIFISMAIWNALGEESWFLKVLQKTFGSFLLVGSVIVLGLAAQPV